MDLLVPRDRSDKLAICIIIVIGATRSKHVLIGESDKLGIGLKVFWRHNDDEFDGALLSKRRFEKSNKNLQNLKEFR